MLRSEALQSVAGLLRDVPCLVTVGRTWTEWTVRDWMDPLEGEGPEFLRQATQVKNIWIPYGE